MTRIIERTEFLNTFFNDTFFNLLTNKAENYFKYITNLRAYLAEINRNTISDTRLILDLGDDRIQVQNSTFTIIDIREFFNALY